METGRNVMHYALGDNQDYEHEWSKAVLEYLENGYSSEDSKSEVEVGNTTYKILKREKVTAFYDADGNTLFDIENDRLKEEYEAMDFSASEPQSEMGKAISNIEQQAFEQAVNDDIDADDTIPMGTASLKEIVEGIPAPTPEEIESAKENNNSSVYIGVVGAVTKLQEELKKAKDKSFADPIIKHLIERCRGSESLASDVWSVLVQSDGENILTRYFCHVKDFRLDFHNPRITTSEGYRTIHRDSGVTDYMWARYKNTDMRWCYYRDRYTGWYPPSESIYPRSVVMYNQELAGDIKGTCMQYSVPDVFINKIADDPRYFNTPWLIDNYFNAYRKYPFIEQLLKVGFYRMTREFLDDNRQNENVFNSGKRNIMETLGIGKTQYNMLREVGDPSIRDLEILRYKPDLKRDEFQTLRYITDNGRANNYTNYIDMMKYTTLHKVCRYISDKKIKYDHDYFDYIGWIEKMGYDMTNEFNLFPKNFVNVHDEMSKQYVKFKDKQAREDAKRFNQTLKKLRKETKDVEAMNLNIEGLFIRLPNRLEELKKEGEALHHCVGTYMERVRKGETMIFFIRRKEEPEKPYYTLEWHGKVVQCRGSHNCDMTPEVKAFVQIFQEKMTEYASEPPKHRKAG